MENIEKSMLETFKSNRMLVSISLRDNEKCEGYITAFDCQVIAVEELNGKIHMIYRQYVKKIGTIKVK